MFGSRDGGNKWDVISPGLIDLHDVQIHPRDSDLIVAVGGFYDENGELRSVVLSEDGGQTWEFTGPPRQTTDQRVHRVALDPEHQDTMYVSPFDYSGPVEPGLGMAKSTDRGRTWHFINAGLGRQDVTAIAIDPARRSTVYAGTSSGKIFKTTDGGEKWKSSSTGFDGGRVMDIALNPTGSATVYVAAQTGTYKSTDGGQRWVRKTEGAECVMLHPLSPRTLLAGRWGDVSVSTDEGETWSAFDTAGLGPFQIYDLVADPANPERFLVGTERGVFSYTRKGSPGGPVIEQLSPSTGRAGDVVTINGKGFGQLQSDSEVLFGTLDAGIAQSWSDTSIKVTVPNGAQTGPVTVVVLGKKSNPYEFIVLPSSGNVYPTSGPAKGGTRVTILAPRGTSGTRFNVLFGATVAGDVRFTQPNVITCDNPPGTGTVDVKVTSSVTSTTVGTSSYC